MLGAAGAGSLIALYGVATAHIDASGSEVEPPAFPWQHNGLLTALDHASVRRGYQVYAQVCAACHSLEQLTYGSLIGVSHTEEEARAIAEEVRTEGTIASPSCQLFVLSIDIVLYILSL
jgi:ubiquinol-cytochrome c reductase cytochrome c1 subunit